VAKVKLEQAYPKIAFRWRSRNWWARLTRIPPECQHLEHGGDWMATYAPDTLYLRGKASALRRPARPEVSLCRACLLGELETELASYQGRIVGFEPDGEAFTQYFFVGTSEFEAAGLIPDVASAISRRLDQPAGDCVVCDATASWLWFTREDVASLDEVNRIAMARGEPLCARHGAQKLCATLTKVSEANLFYMNSPYGEAGAYLWI
jgi:hypothetical protein